MHHTQTHKKQTTHKQPCISTAVEPRRRSSSAHGNLPPINRPYHQPPSEVSSAERWYLEDRPISLSSPPTMPPISSHRSARTMIECIIGRTMVKLRHPLSSIVVSLPFDRLQQRWLFVLHRRQLQTDDVNCWGTVDDQRSICKYY